LLIALCALTPILSGCLSPRRTPNLERIFAAARERTGKRPIIVIPGILGSELVNSETGEVAWPSIFRASDDGLALPVSADLQSNRDRLQPRKIIDIARLSQARLGPEMYVYRDLLDALRRYGGYREGDWANPAADGDRDTFYVYPYDWRRDNVETARDFVRRLLELKRKLNRPDLRFNVVAHSMGGLIARYAARYGDADLPDGEARPVPNWSGAAHINKIIMFGTPNEGSADAFATILEGYSVTTGVRRRIPLLNKLSREDIFTSPAIFQLLPHAGTAHFLDQDLQPLKVDLYDPATWHRYGWSPVTNEDYRRRFIKGETRGDDAPFRAGKLEDLDAYFATVLRRARRFQEALDVPAESETPILLFVFGGDCEETLDAPVIFHDEKSNRWVTLVRPREFRTSAGRKVSRDEAARAMYAPGDGRVTRRSVLAETLAASHRNNPLFETALPIAYAVFGCDLHGYLQNNKLLLDNALTSLVSEAMK
jgi:pimeloyl-ACP methyl ester carboxylesterase